MRILVSGDIFPDSFARNIVVTLERMGHEVASRECSAVRRKGRAYRDALWPVLARALPGVERWKHNSLVERAERFQPDLVLVTHGHLPPAVVDRLRKVTTARIAFWFPDAVSNLGRQYILASSFDAWFFKDPYMASIFREKLGLDAHYLPEACNPLWHRRTEPTESDRKKYGCDLATAGNMYYYRAKTLEPFRNYDLKIWGRSYPRWLKSPLRKCCQDIYVAEEEKARAYNAARIVLNTMHYGEIEGVNCRLFEAAGCGAFQIADWKPALPELFEPEREIVTFRTRRELKEKVDYYLAHPDERREIAARACACAHRDHTYQKRLEKMFEVLGLARGSGLAAPEAVTLGAC
jgi:spore maturation protein CgeB